MKYRIIHEVDGNDKEHWEVQFLEKHWYGYVWENTARYVCGGQFTTKQEYKTLEEATHAVNARICRRTVHEEGVINEHRNEV